MSPQTAAPFLPDWQLERYRLGELPADQGHAVGRALHQDPAARQRLADLEQDDAAILDHYPPRQVAAGIRARWGRLPQPPAGPARLRPLRALALGAAVVACLTVLAPSTSVGPPPATRVKGLSPHLLVFRQRATPTSEIERLLPGTTVRQHDLVQLAYHAAGRRYGVIVSIDGRGLVTRHLPELGPQAVPLKPGPVALPQSYELDDAPAFECFYLVAADRPFEVDRVVAAVRRRHAGPSAAGEPARLDLPPSMDQSTFVLRKEPVR